MNPPQIKLTDADLKRQSPLETQYKRIKKSNDPRFGDVQIYQDPKNKQMLVVKEEHINDKKAAERAVLQARSRVGNRSPYILGLIDYSVDFEKGLCSSFYNLRLFYEYPQTDLKKESIDRKKAKLGFNSDELIHLLYQQVNAHKHLELSRSFHGDVRPLNWALTRSVWESKLIHKEEDISTRANIIQVQMNRQKHGDDLYQSPAMFENMKKKNKDFAFNPNKEDMFATALVLIELGNGESIQNIYKAKDGKFDHNAMRTHVARFEQRFSGVSNQLLVTSILTMLEPEESRRPHFILLEERMPPYGSIREFILNEKIDPSKNGTNKPLETFIYIDQSIIESFKLEPGVSQPKYQQWDAPVTTVVNTRYSDRNIQNMNYVHSAPTNGRIVERIIRKFEDVDGKMLEKVEHYDVKENDELIKRKEYYLVDGKETKLVTYNAEGKKEGEKKEDKPAKKPAKK